MNENTSAKDSFSVNKKAEFEILVKKNMRRAYFAAFGLVGSHDAAMDLSQDAFIRAYRGFGKFDSTKNFFTWYYKILKNLCLNFIRDSKRIKKENYLELREDKLTVASAAGETEKNELLEKLQFALEELSIDDREIIVLKEFEEHSYKELSELLNIPIGSVMSRLFYARKKLSEKMKGML